MIKINLSLVHFPKMNDYLVTNCDLDFFTKTTRYFYTVVSFKQSVVQLLLQPT